jgi:hypothetical protein
MLIFSLGPDMTAMDGQERCDIFGENIIPPPRSASILEIVWETIVDDPILKILILGAIVVLSVGTAICPTQGWIEVSRLSSFHPSGFGHCYCCLYCLGRDSWK